ncbi:MAG: hypothetical protein HY559_00760 [Gammaproteobacteria bacterium]|nr:hypothetical protein [Gammaproteobacteria bacterium]
MKHDPIVEEVRKYRDQFAAKHHYNFEEIFHSIKMLEKKNKRIVHLPSTGKKCA